MSYSILFRETTVICTVPTKPHDVTDLLKYCEEYNIYNTAKIIHIFLPLKPISVVLSISTLFVTFQFSPKSKIIIHTSPENELILIGKVGYIKNPKMSYVTDRKVIVDDIEYQYDEEKNILLWR